MASINSRVGKLYIDFRYFGKRCREMTLLDDNKPNRKRLENFITKLEAEISLGTFRYEKYFPNSKKLGEFQSLELIKETNSHHDASMRFEQFGKQWIAEKKPEWRASQIQNVEDIFRLYLNPSFGNMAVNCIKKALIMQFRGQLVEQGNDGKPLSASRINHIMTPLRMVLNEASERFEFESPWKNIKPLTVPKSDIQPFSLDEVMLILDNVRQDFKPYYTLRFFTGLRTGEIDGLPWKNVDFERRQIIINQAVVNGEIGGSLKLPATDIGGQPATLEFTAGQDADHSGADRRRQRITPERGPVLTRVQHAEHVPVGDHRREQRLDRARVHAALLQHPQHAQNDGLVLGRVFSVVHLLLLSFS